MIRAAASVAIAALLCPLSLFAQEPADGMSGMPGMERMSMPEAPLGLPMERAGSGTAWQPDATPMHAHHLMLPGEWMLMIHGIAFFGYDRQWSARGGDALPSTNWLMAMASHSVGDRGLFTSRAMFSAEPWTVPPRGYPLLLQTGETFHDEPLHDTQHPHDLFMELSASIAAPVSRDLAFEVYAAPSGEPALGPVAFPHRLSASAAPLAPLGHHWEDSTHVSFGVVTAGAYTRFAKIETSWFNGREPNQDRANFDFRPLDSFSARATVNPLAVLSLQASYGYLASPEAHLPLTSEHRATASATLDLPFAMGSNAATTVVWGRKMPSGGEKATDAFLAETTVDLMDRLAVFARAERVTKPGHDLSLSAFDEERLFTLDAATLGAIADAPPLHGLVAGAGGQLMIERIPADLEPYYGTRSPAGFMLFVRVRFAAAHGHHHSM